MTTRSVFIATPAFGGQVAIQYVGSLLGTISTLNAAGIKCIVSLVHGGPYIASERNHAVRRFLASDCTHLLFIDADIEFPHDAALRLIERDVPIVAGLYRHKHDSESYPVRVLNKEDGTPRVTKDGLIECDGLPTGFMLIHREAVKMMIKLLPETAYVENEHRLYALFDHKTIDGQWWGEDYIFCRHWLSIGGELFADPDITFKHCGSKSWEGNFHQFMLRQPGGSEYPAKEKG